MEISATWVLCVGSFLGDSRECAAGDERTVEGVAFDFIVENDFP